MASMLTRRLDALSTKLSPPSNEAERTEAWSSIAKSLGVDVPASGDPLKALLADPAISSTMQSRIEAGDSISAAFEFAAHRRIDQNKITHRTLANEGERSVRRMLA